MTDTPHAFRPGVTAPAAGAAPGGRPGTEPSEPAPAPADVDGPKRLLLVEPPRPRSRLATLYRPVEWRLEQVVTHLKAWAVIDLIQLGSTLFVAVSAGIYLWTRGDQVRAQREAQRAARQSAAWHVIDAAQGKGGSGGRIDALQTLANDGVVLDGVVLTGAYLVGLALRPGTSLRAATLDSSNLEDARLVRVSLKEATLVGARLGGARLDGASLWRARLDGAKLSDARLDEANLWGARLDGAELVGARLDRANLVGATFAGSILLGATLTRADLSSATLTDAVLEGATLTHAVLAGTTFTGSLLRNARLDSADLSHARLDDTDVSYATFEGADLRLACLDGVQGWQDIRSIAGARIASVRAAPPGFRAWALARGASEADAAPDTTGIGLPPCPLPRTRTGGARRRP